MCYERAALVRGKQGEGRTKCRQRPSGSSSSRPWSVSDGFATVCAEKD